MSWLLPIAPITAPDIPGGVAMCAGIDAEHIPSAGVRYDFMRLAMVADCRRCGAVLMLDQSPAGDRIEPHTPKEANGG